MTRGHRPSSNSNTTTSSSSAAATSSSNQQQQTPRRGNKTLGWYLGDKLNGNSVNANEGDSGGNGGGKDISSTFNSQMAPQSRPGIPHQPQRRRGSLAETTALNCSKPSGKLSDEPQQQNNPKMGKRHLHQQQQKQQSVTNSNSHRPRANSSSTNAGSKKTGSTTPAIGQSGTASISTNDSSILTAQPRIGKGPNSGKDDYWYYDEASDGFYYEHNGTRGWRKRRPEWGTVEQMKGTTGTEQSPKRAPEQQQMVLLQQQLLQKQKALEAKASSASCAGVPSLLAPQQLSKFAAKHLPHEHLLSPTPAHFKYYDPTTDGFYYEMASFDGWKRRQPHSGVSAADGTSPPQGTLSPPSSYCSPFLNGNCGGDQQMKMPPATAQQPWLCTSPVPPNHQKQPAPHRKVQPLHYQAYQQPAPQLNPAELQEMILLAQKNQHHLRSAAASVPSCCCAQLSCSQNLTENGTSACYCSNIAAMAAQMVLKQQQKLADQMHCHQQNNFMDNNKNMMNNSALTAAEDNKLSSTDNIRSLLDMNTKLSLGENFVMGPTVVRSNHNQQQISNNNNSGATNLRLPRNKWDNHQLGGFVPSPPPLLPSLQRNGGRRSSSTFITTTNGNTPTTTTKTTTALSIGSFEEPYEFYWSGDEAGSEVTPLGTADCGNQQQNEQKMMNAKDGEQQSMEVPPFMLSTATTTAASVSSIEEDDLEGYGMLEQYMAEMTGTMPNSEKQRKIAPIGSEANHLGNGNKKRLNTLKLTCQKPLAIVNNGNEKNGLSTAYEPISPGEILDDEQQLEYNTNDRKKEGVADSPGVVSYLPYQFNVDKFIEDMFLPSSSQQQSLYNPNSTSTSNLFTPLAQQPHTADSPLFTPIGSYGVKDPWYYDKSKDFSQSAVHPLQQHQQLMDGTNTWAYP